MLTYVVEPTVAVPCPAGDGTVDDCCPPEAEDQGWDDASSFESTTDDDLYCAGTVRS